MVVGDLKFIINLVCWIVNVNANANGNWHFCIYFNLIGIGIGCLARIHITHPPFHIHKYTTSILRSTQNATQVIDQLDTLQIFHNLFFVLVGCCVTVRRFSIHFLCSVAIVIFVAALNRSNSKYNAQSNRNVYNVCHRLK